MSCYSVRVRYVGAPVFPQVCWLVNRFRHRSDLAQAACDNQVVPLGSSHPVPCLDCTSIN